ncbi:MAG: chemotaxis protein CheX [Bryobacterales bacterium]|nr:chemotaxis protein CheX [Bryobacterales bacterium]
MQIIQAAAHEVFTTMLGMEVTCERPPSEAAAFLAPAEGVVSLVGLTGRWAGTGCVSCSGPLACRVTSRMLMTPVTAVGEEVLDVMAEVTNMIIGNVKAGLEEALGPMGLSTPTVVYGRNFSTRNVRDGQLSISRFRLDGEPLEVKICLAPGLQANPPARHGPCQPEVSQR